MKKLFEFKCKECNEVFEELTEYKKTSTCPSCQGEADKIISAPRVALEGITGSFPGAAFSWEQKHIKATKQEQKRNAEF